MADGQPVTTGTPAGVGGDAQAAPATPAVPSVSGAASASGAPPPPPAPPVAPPAPPAPLPPTVAPVAMAPVPAEPPRTGSPSDPENRIRELQSRGDKLQADLDRRNQAYVDLENAKRQLEAQLNQTVGERSAVLNTAAEKVQTAMTEQEQLKAQNAELAGKLARLEALRANPELTEYAELLPVTTDADALAKAVETLKAARQRDRAAVSGSLSAGVPPAGAPPPLAPGTPPTAPDIRARLLEAKSPAEFTQLAKELSLQVQAAQRPPGT
jgi:hypothetical protein